VCVCVRDCLCRSLLYVYMSVPVIIYERSLMICVCNACMCSCVYVYLRFWFDCVFFASFGCAYIN